MGPLSLWGPYDAVSHCTSEITCVWLGAVHKCLKNILVAIWFTKHIIGTESQKAGRPCFQLFERKVQEKVPDQTAQSSRIRGEGEGSSSWFGLRTEWSWSLMAEVQDSIPMAQQPFLHMSSTLLVFRAWLTADVA